MVGPPSGRVRGRSRPPGGCRGRFVLSSPDKRRRRPNPTKGRIRRCRRRNRARPNRPGAGAGPRARHPLSYGDVNAEPGTRRRRRGGVDRHVGTRAAARAPLHHAAPADRPGRGRAVPSHPGVHGIGHPREARPPAAHRGGGRRGRSGRSSCPRRGPASPGGLEPATSAGTGARPSRRRSRRRGRCRAGGDRRRPLRRARPARLRALRAAARRGSAARCAPGSTARWPTRHERDDRRRADRRGSPDPRLPGHQPARRGRPVPRGRAAHRGRLVARDLAVRRHLER